jgi:hypothetical protein
MRWLASAAQVIAGRLPRGKTYALDNLGITALRSWGNQPTPAKCNDGLRAELDGLPQHSIRCPWRYGVGTRRVQPLTHTLIGHGKYVHTLMKAAARSNGLVKALPLSSNRCAVVGRIWR